MSSTRTYTPLADPDGDSGAGVRINDYDAYESHLQEFSGKSLTPLTVTSKTKDEDVYPRTYTEYEYLQGFTAYPDQHDFIDETTILKLENFGFEYNREFFVEFWERVASYCEPFTFLHAPANHFPSTADVIRGGWPDYVYRVTVIEGDIRVEDVSVTFEASAVED